MQALTKITVHSIQSNYTAWQARNSTTNTVRGVIIKSLIISFHVILIRPKPRTPVRNPAVLPPIFVSSWISIRTDRFFCGTGGRLNITCHRLDLSDVNCLGDGAGNGRTFGTSGRWYPICTSNVHLPGFCLSNIRLVINLCVPHSSNVRGTRNAPSHRESDHHRTTDHDLLYNAMSSVLLPHLGVGRWWQRVRRKSILHQRCACSGFLQQTAGLQQNTKRHRFVCA